MTTTCYMGLRIASCGRIVPRRNQSGFDFWRYIDFSFFFQAEDGIRDVAVTGVQTCALPIYMYSVASDQFSPPYTGFANYTDAPPTVQGVPQMQLSNPFTSAFPVVPSYGKAYGEIGRASCRERV